MALTPTRYRLLLPKPLRTLHAQVAQNLDNSLSQTELVEKMKVNIRLSLLVFLKIFIEMNRN